MKTFKDLLEEIQNEAKDDEMVSTPPNQQPQQNAPKDDDDDDEENEPSEKDLPDGKGHYTADDLREIIDYVRDLIEKELKDVKDDDEDTKEDDIGEIGLDLIYEYADLLPETVINQIVDDLKDFFEIEDTMLEAILEEGSAFFTKSSKGSAAQAARKSFRAGVVKNIKKIKKRNSKWRNTEMGQKIAALHKKIFKGTANLGKAKGKRVVHKDGF